MSLPKVDPAKQVDFASKALDQLRGAYKRACHFAAPFDGPFSALKSPLGNNYARMVYAEPDGSVDQLVMFDEWAAALNRKADGGRVADDLPLREAFGSFLSLLWFDPTGAGVFHKRPAGDGWMQAPAGSHEFLKTGGAFSRAH